MKVLLLLPAFLLLSANSLAVMSETSTLEGQIGNFDAQTVVVRSGQFETRISRSSWPNEVELKPEAQVKVSIPDKGILGSKQIKRRSRDPLAD